MAEQTPEKVVNTQKKKTVIQIVKAVAVLVVICLVCGLLLALCNDLLYVSEEEKFNRAMKKIYPKFEKEADVELTEKAVDANYGAVESVVKSKDGTYVIKSTGKGGYGGNVTIYLAVGADKLIKGISIVEGKGETLLGNISEKNLKDWYVGKAVDGDLSLGDRYVPGTTMTSTAINNAVNMAAQYCSELGLTVDVVGEAKAAVLALLGADYADYALDRYNILDVVVEKGGDKVKDKLSDSDNEITYIFAGDGAKGRVTAYVYGSDENRKIVATTSAGIVKTENVEGTEEFVTKISKVRVMSFTYNTNWNTTAQAYALVTDISASGDTSVYTVAGLRVGTVPNTYILTVTISKDGEKGKVDSVALTQDGWASGSPQAPQDKANILLTKLEGATSETIENIYKTNAVQGATQSSNLIAVAVQTALADFDATLASQNI